MPLSSDLGNVSADGFTLSEQEDLTLNGTAIQSKALMVALRIR